MRLQLCQRFLSNWQKKAFQTLKKKTDELTDMRDFGEFPSLSFFGMVLHSFCYSVRFISVKLPSPIGNALRTEGLKFC